MEFRLDPELMIKVHAQFTVFSLLTKPMEPKAKRSKTITITGLCTFEPTTTNIRGIFPWERLNYANV
jgi:hypothetical protein